ncbi:MAG: D-alanine--D-alanine ligase family protein [Planctomycetota bacterium]
MINVAVLAGGRSPEHGISLWSARQVLLYLDRANVRPFLVKLHRDGIWSVSREPLAEGEQPDEEFLVPGMVAMRPGAALDYLVGTADVDVAFPILHGPGGEDGTVQGMLELYDLPCVGSGCAASAVAMDKIRTRECLLQNDLPMAPAYVAETPLAAADAGLEAERIAQSIGFPCFLKVDHSGSTLGVARASGPADVAVFLDGCRHMGRRFMAETEVTGEEITVAVLGNTGQELTPLPPVGIYPVDDGYFTHSAKYDPGACEEIVPPRGLSEAQIRRVQELGLRCHRALQCDGMSRTDMILGSNGPVILEVNTIPGLTEASLLPKAARAHGLSFTALIDRLLELALQRSGARTIYA